MGKVTVRSFEEPDQTVPLGTGVADIVTIGSTMSDGRPCSRDGSGPRT